ncbi:helix-turn-helix domain-containing protein [Streptomyces griseofuscus]|uniref:helix-turn-helix domain-containing protein n=1 Tax=Streptomyces griseofuscus TaxID=146922 RepID=UPI0033F37463
MKPGELVRQTRKAKGLTLAELGTMTGYSRAQVSRYERGCQPCWCDLGGAGAGGRGRPSARSGCSAYGRSPWRFTDAADPGRQRALAVRSSSSGVRRRQGEAGRGAEGSSARAMVIQGTASRR